MDETQRLLQTLKRQFKVAGLTYRHVAQASGLSEPSIKRLLNGGGITLERLCQLAALAGLTVAELAEAAAHAEPELHRLTVAQEASLVADDRLLLVAVCALNHWSLTEITACYRLEELDVLQRLLQLDRMGLIALLPGNRIRLNVARDFDWLPDGPIQGFFRERGQPDFLADDFAGDSASLQFAHAMLSPAALAQLQRQLRRLRQDLAELHRDSLAVPLAQRCGVGLLLALREWEPAAFAGLRR
ncbi:helix-turn-helix domain-containing protein [Chitinolyticbacter meiyuanensis]|uniref:helix-turn-helix domain-containing protein n=1 Tax=Chitinolyticbacter meiyuanensis TaxID=682798 RepID=UPI0011E5EA22|nr:helix-turn-helix domain-containing protein [Chitinolyticbacter meiyuanensis]